MGKRSSTGLVVMVKSYMYSKTRREIPIITTRHTYLNPLSTPHKYSAAILLHALAVSVAQGPLSGERLWSVPAHMGLLMGSPGGIDPRRTSCSTSSDPWLDGSFHRKTKESSVRISESRWLHVSPKWSWKGNIMDRDDSTSASSVCELSDIQLLSYN